MSSFKGQHKKKRHLKKVMCVGYLMGVTLSLLGSALASYTSNGSREDEARLAKFHYLSDSDEVDNKEIEMVPDKMSEDTYTFRITNDSEVASMYKVKVSNVLGGMKVRLVNNNQTIIVPIVYDKAGTLTGQEIVFDPLELDRGETKEISLVFNLETATNKTINHVSNYKVSVIGEQLD